MARYRIIEDRECSEPACRYELTEGVTVKWPWFLAGATLAIAAPVTVSAQGQYPVRTVPGYQCMALAHVWNGIGPMPPPVPEFAGPEKTAPKSGIAMATVIVDSPARVADGRTRVLRPDGQVAWIDSSELAPWHVVSNPNARCRVVQMSNGLFGTTSN